MSKKKQPLNFADPAPADMAPAAELRDDQTLDLPAMPGGQEAVETASPADLSVAVVRPPEPQGAGAYVYLLAAAATVLWAGGLAAYVVGYRSHLGPFENEPFAATVLALLALAPVGLIWIGAFALRQGVRLMAEARRLQALSDQILGPAALAAAQTGSIVDGIRLEVDSALQTVSQARGQLLQLRHGLAEEAQRLMDAAAGSERAGAHLVKTLGDEREGFAALSGRLDVQASDIGDAIARHARMVAEASDLAQAQIHEAEAALAARAADLAAAAGEATDAARIAGDDLSRQAVRLEAAGVSVGEQVQMIEEGLGQQRAALVSLAQTMRTDQEDLAVNFETQKAQFLEILRQSELESQQLSSAAVRGADVLRDLIGQAADQLRELGEQAQTERDLLGGAGLQSLGAFSEAAAFERRALEEETQRAIAELSAAAEAAHKAAETASEAAKRKVEDLSEAAFAAGQQADSAFEERLAQAQGLIERSVSLVDEAGARSAAKLDQGVGAARSALDALQRSLAEIDARTARLPADAEARGLQIKVALDTATEALLGSARTAAAELQAIDDAFQDRVKRNYEMLSEAVRLMGVIGGGAAARASGGLTPAPRPPRPSALRPEPALRPRLSEASTPEPRRRLKLTPTASDEAVSTVFEPAADRRAAEPEGDGDSWSWSDLLSSLDGDAEDAGELEEILVEEIRALGVDPIALFPAARIDDIATALETGDVGGAREIAHRQAPAAIRKLARRVLSDKLLRSQADRFVQQQSARLSDALRQGQTRLAIARALGTETGRAYLMFDAAIGDLN
ncbi:MAG TPA: polar localization protein TipN [Caulobacteraceae bacterium]|nr:polar localization protein TipN [Caulobacteraceae bacterium]